MLGPKCHEGGITGAGNPEYGVVAVGIAPGKDEIRRTHTPFTGPSGILFDDCLSAIGWSRDKVYTTNVICWNKDDPTPEEIQHCMPRLQQEISSCNPRLIITMGKIATESLIENGDFGHWRGYPHWNNKFGCYILSTYHPSAVLQDGPFIEDILRDLKKIPLVLSWPPVVAEATVNWRYIADTAELQAWLDRLQPNQKVSLDIETGTKQIEDDDEKDIWEGQLLCFAMTTEWDGIEDTILVQPAVARGVKWPLHARWTFQNGPFDVQGLMREYGVWLPICDDTMLQSYALDERKGIHKLKRQAREYLGCSYYESAVSIHIKSGKGASLVDRELHEYNAKDAAYTYRLSKKYDSWLVNDGVDGYYRSLLLPGLKAFGEIQHRGVAIDQQQLRRVGIELLELQLVEDERLLKYANDLGFEGDINFNSPKQMQHLLFDVLGLPVIKLTKSGQPSTDKDVLAELEDAHPFMSMLGEFRHLTHTNSSFVAGIDDDIKVDGKVHPSGMLHTTRTGRATYSRPPMQTIIKPGQIKSPIGSKIDRIRSFFVPHNPDTHFILEADLQRAELWTAYAHSHDKNMLADLLSGDFHAAAAKDIFNLDEPIESISDYWRRRSKYVSFGIMFGRGAEALGRGELQCDKREAQKYVDRWYSRYHDYFEWTTARKREADSTGEVVAPFTGAKRRFPLIMGKKTWHSYNQAVNFPIQHTSHAVELSALIELHDTLRELDSYVLFEVHDCIVFEVAHRYRNEAIHRIHAAMTRPRFDGMVGIPVDMKAGPNWYDVKALCESCLVMPSAGKVKQHHLCATCRLAVAA